MGDASATPPSCSCVRGEDPEPPPPPPAAPPRPSPPQPPAPGTIVIYRLAADATEAAWREAAEAQMHTLYAEIVAHICEDVVLCG